jgi:PAS domain S-box-containing protein
MSHVESHRLFVLAHLPAIVDQPEWEHIQKCPDCGLAFIGLVHLAEQCSSRLLRSEALRVDLLGDLMKTGDHSLHASILDSVDDAVISKTLDGVISSWNSAASRIFGYTANEAVGQSIKIIIPPELSDEEDDILRRLRSGLRIDQYETRRVSKDGRTINVSITVSPVRDATGEVIGASKVARDITQTKRAEALP